MTVLVNAMGLCCPANYLTEYALLVSPPKLWDRSTSLGFNYERSHVKAGQVGCCVDRHDRQGSTGFYPGQIPTSGGCGFNI
jgi:hypothetical protein